MLNVIRPGVWSSIQDLGRHGFRHLGVPVSGAMDADASRFANMLLNNPESAAVLEMTMNGPELEFESASCIAIAGANMQPQLNGEPVHMHTAINVFPGDRLQFDHTLDGLRSYLAIEKGFQTEVNMGSASYYPNITKKQRIEKGDQLSYIECTHRREESHAAVNIDPAYFKRHSLEVFAGPEYQQLGKSRQLALRNAKFRVSNLYDRSAYQLQEKFKNILKPILTSAVLPGTVQLTPSGRLIILMRDCQTTGGYPRVLQLNEAAINLLSQKKMGDKVSFSMLPDKG
ncbi:MAG: biotin-dependent carboxyltransferase family protein [Gammaproteobacteria bacterium]|nr:biotin-dependent carboxyltransferase family protein [Gammaproteobacteria bacterium]NNC96917.1 biotin-dependent carboxyltransferase family protein [Gammaproteobacteria bacterium]NNM13332.1 biotin-dependent carboxyltransferase family protein [Gammaproteobacteria bacterium]